MPEKQKKLLPIPTVTHFSKLWMHLLAIAWIPLPNFLSFSIFPLNLLPTVSDRAASFLQQLLRLTPAFLQGSSSCLLHLAGLHNLHSQTQKPCESLNTSSYHLSQKKGPHPPVTIQAAIAALVHLQYQCIMLTIFQTQL